MIDWIYDPQIWASLITLTLMEIILGIDNIVFISVLVSKLEPRSADKARKIGLALALIMRILLLMVIAWIIGLTKPLFEIFGHSVSWRDVILIVGGGFLLFKATHEIHNALESEEDGSGKGAKATFIAVVMQILVIDVVFSVDSIITAVGMADHVEVMIAAVIIAMIVMYLASGTIADFIKRHPTTKMLALSFLLLIGVALIADGLGFHIPRGYIYFAMAFAAGVEFINIAARKARNRRKQGDV